MATDLTLEQERERSRDAARALKDRAHTAVETAKGHRMPFVRPSTFVVRFFCRQIFRLKGERRNLMKSMSPHRSAVLVFGLCFFICGRAVPEDMKMGLSVGLLKDWRHGSLWIGHPKAGAVSTAIEFRGLGYAHYDDHRAAWAQMAFTRANYGPAACGVMPFQFYSLDGRLRYTGYWQEEGRFYRTIGMVVGIGAAWMPFDRAGLMLRQGWETFWWEQDRGDGPDDGKEGVFLMGLSMARVDAVFFFDWPPRWRTEE